MKSSADGFATFFQHETPTATASMEARDPYGEWQAEQQVETLNRAIAHECTRATTLEALIATMESAETTLTPFQVTMVQHAAHNAGVTLAHASLGFGMEAYQGPRGHQLLTISTEGFKDALKKILAKILALYHRLKAWITKLLDRRSAEAEWIVGELKKPQGKAKLSESKALQLAEILSINGKLDIKGVVANTDVVVGGATSTAYTGAVSKYGEQVSSVLMGMLKDPQSWRTAAKNISSLSLPVPQVGFEQFKSVGQVAEYRSLALAESASIRITTTPSAAGGGSEGGNDGVRGAEARAAALSSAGAVSVDGEVKYTGNAAEELKHAGNASVLSAAHRMIEIMGKVVTARRSSDFLFQHLPQQEKQLTQAVASPAEMEPRIVTMGTELITSIGKASASATSVLGAVTGRAIRAGRAIAILHHHDLAL